MRYHDLVKIWTFPSTSGSVPDMNLLSTILMALWIWIFIGPYATKYLASWLIHLTLIPLLAYGCWHTQAETRNVLAVAGGLMLLQLLVVRDLSGTKPVVKTRRKSSIPPPP